MHGRAWMHMHMHIYVKCLAYSRVRSRKHESIPNTEISYCDTSAEAIATSRVKLNVRARMNSKGKQRVRCVSKRPIFYGDSASTVFIETVEACVARNELLAPVNRTSEQRVQRISSTEAQQTRQV